MGVQPIGGPTPISRDKNSLLNSLPSNDAEDGPPNNECACETAIEILIDKKKNEEKRVGVYGF